MSEKIKIASLRKMTEENLTALAREKFSIDAEGMDKDDIIDSIMAAQADAPEAAEERLFNLVIHSSDSSGGHDDVHLGINGYAYSIKRDMDVIVPERVIEALKLCVTTKYEPGGINKNTLEMEYKTYDARRFNFSASPVK